MGNVNADLRCTCGDALREIRGGLLVCEECIRLYARVDDIVLSGWNPRADFNSDELDELIASIVEYGILEPLILRWKDDKLELVAGERRFRAAGRINLVQSRD